MRLLTARKVANQPGSWQPMNNGDRDGKSTAVYVSFVGRTFLDSQGSSENPDTREYSTKNSVSWRTLNDGSGENDENGKNKENVKDDDHDRKNALRWERAKKVSYSTRELIECDQIRALIYEAAMEGPSCCKTRDKCTIHSIRHTPCPQN